MAAKLEEILTNHRIDNFFGKFKIIGKSFNIYKRNSC